tara:strand:+ start:398 stop:532 length:135 start_codon:yes stop_codon:yes gene_type:complete
MPTSYEKWLNKPKGTKDYGSYKEWLKHQPPVKKAKKKKDKLKIA